MFLELTRRRNPDLIRAAVRLHRERVIPANTYVIDLDTVIANARAIAEAAERTGIQNYFMSKHFNRNPLVSWAIVRAGLPGAVAVDVQCAKYLWRFGVPVKHVGHLVQIPHSEVPHVLEMEPEVWTIYSVDKARELSEAAERMGRVQPILLRVRAPQDIIYPNEEGGIWESDLEDAVKQISRMKGVRIAGTVTFPGTLVSEAAKGGTATVNFQTAVRAAGQLRRWGFEVTQINTPGATSSAMLPVIREHGGTHGEPGHGVMGTTPWHLLEDLPERPAMVYVNEVSHTFEDKAYCFGGGFYACDTPANRGDDTPFRLSRRWEPHAYVGQSPEDIFDRRLPVDVGSFFGRTLNATDYYGGTMLMERPDQVKSGDTVIFGFRAQVFTTRSHVAVVRGVSGTPRLVGLFDRANNLLDEKGYPVPDSVSAVRELVKRELGVIRQGLCR
ncbi:MAG: alanine racemase [Bacillota bacterium]|nr:alanine racemase [Bacillota bacterium]